MSPNLNCLNIAELEALATERMDKQTRDYYKKTPQRIGNIVFGLEC